METKEYTVISVVENLPVGGKYCIAVSDNEPLRGEVKVNIQEKPSRCLATIKHMPRRSTEHLEKVTDYLKEHITFRDATQEKDFDEKLKKFSFSEYSESNPWTLIEITNFASLKEDINEVMEYTNNLIDQLLLGFSFNYSLPVEKRFLVVVDNKTNEIRFKMSEGRLRYENMKTFEEEGVKYICPKEDLRKNMGKISTVLAWEYKDVVEGKKDDLTLSKCLKEYKRNLRRKPLETAHYDLMANWTILTMLSRKYSGNLNQSVKSLFEDYNMLTEYNEIKASSEYRGSWEHYRIIPEKFKAEEFDFKGLSEITEMLLLRVFDREFERIREDVEEFEKNKNE